MRVVHVSFADGGGGAFRAAYRVHRALASEGVDSRLLVRSKRSGDPEVAAIGTELVARGRAVLEHRMQKFQRTTNHALHSSNLLPSRVARLINRLAPDVVQVHWIGHGTLSIVDLARLEPPVVMRLPDMWAFSGSEHYGDASLNARWRAGYAKPNRPAGHRGIDLDRLTWSRKAKRWSQMDIVCPSRWLASLASDSALMHDWPIHVIPNPLDVEVFRPVDRRRARHELRLDVDGDLVAFASVEDVANRTKGFDLLLEALGRLASQGKSVTAVVIGQAIPTVPPRLPVPIRWLGRLDDDPQLRLAYSAADVLVVPSRQEAFGQVASEAQACGTPVVAFDNTGVADIVEHWGSGYLARHSSTEDLARGISWVLGNAKHRSAVAAAARGRAIGHFSSSAVARQYVAVYDQAVGRRADAFGSTR